MSPDQKPTPEDLVDAIFGSWDGQKRKRGLLERTTTIERILILSVPILVAKALGVPTDLVGKFFSPTGVAYSAQHIIALFMGFPK